MGEFDRLPVAAYRGASASTEDLTRKLSEAWREVVEDPVDRANVAGFLELDPDAVRALNDPPLLVRKNAGIVGAVVVTTIVTSFASEVLLGAVKGLAQDEVKRRIKQVWGVVEPRLRKLLNHRDELGRPVADDYSDR